jgi:hypothetical protein
MMAASRIAGGLLLAAAVALVWFDFRDVRAFEALRDAELLPAPPGQAFHTYSHPPAARRAARDWRVDPQLARSILGESLSLYPLESGPWLALARMEASQGRASSPDLAAHLEAAVSVQPLNDSVRWEAAQIALHGGDALLAQGHLEHWVRDDARRVPVALSIAQRWIEEPQALVASLVPATLEHQTEAMEFALRQGNDELAELIWAAAAGTQTLASPLFLTFADYLMSAGQTERLVELWSAHDAEYAPWGVPNGDFSRELGTAQGLNWDVRSTPAGVHIGRDSSEYFDAPASLRLDFKGTHNLGLNRPRLRIPVRPGVRYRLAGYWKGEALTTRARPYITVRMLGARWNERIPVPGDLFGWEEFAVDFETPETVRMIEFAIRRDPTDNFDRNIDGDLWLDSLRLDTLADPLDAPMAGTAP